MTTGRGEAHMRGEVKTGRKRVTKVQSRRKLVDEESNNGKRLIMKLSMQGNVLYVMNWPLQE